MRFVCFPFSPWLTLVSSVGRERTHFTNRLLSWCDLDFYITLFSVYVTYYAQLWVSGAHSISTSFDCELIWAALTQLPPSLSLSVDGVDRVCSVHEIVSIHYNFDWKTFFFQFINDWPWTCGFMLILGEVALYGLVGSVFGACASAFVYDVCLTI